MGNSSAHAVALAAVVLLNWVLLLISPHMAMPQDVQSAAQTLIGVAYGAWFASRSNPSPGSGSSGIPSSVDQATKA